MKRKNNREARFRLASKVVAGLGKHSNLPVAHVTGSTLGSAVLLARGRNAEYADAKAAMRAAQRSVQGATTTCQTYAGICRDVLRPAFGNTHSADWRRAGFKASLSVPDVPEALAELYQSLTRFLTDHANFTNATYNVSAAVAKQRLESLEAALQAVRDARSAQRQKREARDMAEAAMVDQTRAVLNELKAILKPEDPRWMDFVDEVPADEQRPEAVEELTVEGAAPGELTAEWEPSLRADRYQVEIQVSGQDTEFRRVVTVRDPNVTLGGLPPGAAVTLRIVAVNDAGESAPSAEVKATVPVLANAA